MIDASSVILDCIERHAPFHLSCTQRTESEYLLRSPDLSPPHGFSVTVSFSLNSVTLLLKPDPYAKDLVDELQHAASEKSFIDAIQHLQAEGYRPEINGLSVMDNDVSIASASRTFELSIDRLGVILGEDRDAVRLEKFLLNSFSLFALLFPLHEDDEDDVHGFPEGAVSRVRVNKYERNAHNRLACLAHHGYSCRCCGLNMSETYGDVGKGYIQVHHIVPVSSLGEEYNINPVKDLVPVCPNCHSMLHRREPPYTVEELRTIIDQQTS